MEKTPIITVTCYRDLQLLDLQAQSINLYLDKKCPIYIIVNEDDPSLWFQEFEKIKVYYRDHNITIYKKHDFLNDWGYWPCNSRSNPWSLGWQTQQVLKIFISKKIDFTRFLILDTQNFLIRPWSPDSISNKDDKIPARWGIYVMPESIIDDYSKKLNLQKSIDIKNLMSICTPIFLRKDLCDSLIDNFGGEKKFIEWFNLASSKKSEFVLYYLWAEYLKSFNEYHYYVDSDWGGPYLRDCYDKKSFYNFFRKIGSQKSSVWVSVNNRAWGNMDEYQFDLLCKKLKKYRLFPNFLEYRKNYIDFKF